MPPIYDISDSDDEDDVRNGSAPAPVLVKPAGRASRTAAVPKAGGRGVAAGSGSQEGSTRSARSASTASTSRTASQSQSARAQPVRATRSNSSNVLSSQGTADEAREEDAPTPASTAASSYTAAPLREAATAPPAPVPSTSGTSGKPPLARPRQPSAPATTATARRSSSRDPAPPAAAPRRPAPKRKVLTEEEKARRRAQQEAEDAQDDFFTQKKNIVFTSNKAGIKKVPARAPSASATSRPSAKAEGKRPASVSLSSPQQIAKPELKPIEVNLDDDDASSANDSGDSDEDEDDEAQYTDGGTKKSPRKGRGRPKGSRRKDKSKSLSPIKPTYHFSSSSSDSEVYSDDSDAVRKKAAKKEAKRKAKAEMENGTKRKRGREGSSSAPPGKELPARKRSKGSSGKEASDDGLSDIEELDSFVTAHAIQDLRRKTGFVPKSAGTGIAGRYLDEMDMAGHASPAYQTFRHEAATFTTEKTATSASAIASDAGNESISSSTNSVPKVTITVKMAANPRRITADNVVAKTAFETPLVYRLSATAAFNEIVSAVCMARSIEKTHLLLMYQGRKVYGVSTPKQLGIISVATVQGYEKSHWEEMEAEKERKREEDKERAVNDVLQALENKDRIEKLRKAAADRGVIDLDGDGPDEARAGQAIPNGGADDDSDIEVMGSPSKPVNTSTQRSASLSVPPPSNGPSLSPAAAAPSSARLPSLRLTIKISASLSCKLAVPKSKTVLFLIKHVLKAEADAFKGIKGLSAEKCKLLFDGDELDKNALLEETEVEDEDTLDFVAG